MRGDVIWSSGFLDGEGCFQFVKRAGSNTYTGSIEVEQRNPENLYVLQRALGGVGTVTKRKTRNAYRYRIVAAQELHKVLRLVLPHLSFKYPEARALLRGLASNDPEVQKRCAREIKSLKRR